MEVLENSYLLVSTKSTFHQWAEKHDEFFNAAFLEPTVYLIEEDVLDIEPVIKANYKTIFEVEMSAICEEENEFLEINWENFLACFDVEMGATVVSL